MAKLKAVLPELDEHGHQQAISRERFDAVLDVISTKGVSDSYRWMADTVDSVLASRQASPIRNVKLAIRESGCDDFTRGCLAAEILADGICFAATFDPVFAMPSAVTFAVAARVRAVLMRIEAEMATPNESSRRLFDVLLFLPCLGLMIALAAATTVLPVVVR